MNYDNMKAYWIDKLNTEEEMKKRQQEDFSSESK
jgi:hypothetical protein